MISRDRLPYCSVWVKEESVISNNLQSVFLIAPKGGRANHCCKWDSGARNRKLIQLHHHTYIMDSANLENYAWIYFHEDDRDQDWLAATVRGAPNRNYLK